MHTVYILYLYYTILTPSSVSPPPQDRQKSGSVRRTQINAAIQGRRGRGERERSARVGSIKGRQAWGKRCVGGRGERDASAGGGSIATEATRRCTIVAAEGRYKGCIQRRRYDRRGAGSIRMSARCNHSKQQYNNIKITVNSLCNK